MYFWQLWYSLAAHGDAVKQVLSEPAKAVASDGAKDVRQGYHVRIVRRA